MSIKAIARVNNRTTLFVGLSRANTTRLHEDQPIPIDLKAMLQLTPNVDEIEDLVIFAEEDEDAMLVRLRSIGLDIPDPRQVP